MNLLSRRHQILPAYAYCREAGCTWTDSGKGLAVAAEKEAAEHCAETGHEVRSHSVRMTIFTLAQATAPATSRLEQAR